MKVRLLCALLLFALAACGKGETAPKKAPPAAKRVDIAVAESSPLAHVIELEATVEPERVAEIGVKTQGRVETLSAREGDRVGAGKLLARLASPQLQHEAREARALSSAVRSEVIRAEADLEQKRRDAARSARLHAEGVFSAERAEQARTALAMAEATLANLRDREGANAFSSAAVDAEAAELNLVSPIDGVVARRSVELGQIVSPGLVAFRVVDARRLKAVAHAAEQDFAGLRTGLDAEIAVAGDSATGQVNALAPELDPATRLARLEVLFDRPAGALGRFVAGQRARVRVVVDAAEKTVVIPSAAVLAREDRRYVYVVENGKAKERTVKVAFANGGKTAIAEGLAAGEKVIAGRLAGIRDGTSVETGESEERQEKGAGAPGIK